MNAEKFRKLMKEFCRAGGMDESDEAVDSGIVCIDGINLLMYYNEEFGEDRLQLRLDFGEFERNETGSAVLAAILMNNFTWGLGGSHVFSLNPSNGHIVFTMQAFLNDAMTGAQLLDIANDLVKESRIAWEEAMRKLSNLKSFSSSPTRQTAAMLANRIKSGTTA
jgi:hypothetical protein